MTRLFVALLIPDNVKHEIIFLRNLALPDAGAYKWEPPVKIHLTLKFIGEVEDKLVNPIADALDYLTDYDGFKCRFTKFGFFYNRQEAKILWLGLNIENRVFEIVESINTKMQEFSIPYEKRKFKPHLTLKRLKGSEGNNFIRSFEEFEVPPVEFYASKIALFKSDLLPGGSKYTEIKNYNLK